ncbi:MAG: aminoglycoside phosphotransferase family protein [candidate division KSB1 bacterium]|nr:aminoglycoside phosphotransferase family protein [candidate division KSB1 bacterium]
MQLIDRKLPSLGRAQNDEEMRLLLAPLFPGWFDGNGQVLLGVRHQLLKHTPGKRCVIQYQLETSGQATPQQLIGKIYRKDRGRRIFENVHHLWQAADQGARFNMAEPLAYLPELGMILLSAVPGRQLSSFAMDDDLPEALRRVAANLAALHGLEVSAVPERTLEDHLRKFCHPGVELLIAAYPEFRPLVEDLLAGLANDEALREAPLCPVHGDLNLAQIFIAQGHAWFIDFDGFCVSHPALDLGNFGVSLQVHYPARYEALQTMFLEHYLTNLPTRMLTGLRVYQALAYLRRAVIAARTPSVPNWREQVRQLLEAGNTVLA